MSSLVGAIVTWMPTRPGGGNTFARWASASVEGAVPPLTVATSLNCWEVVLLAAFRAKAVDWSWIHDVYTAQAHSSTWGGYLVNRLTPHGRHTYHQRRARGPQPSQGDLVFAAGNGHVALAAGSRDAAGRQQVYSFWPGPPGPRSGMPGAITLTTIEEISQRFEDTFGPTPRVRFGPPAW